MLRSVVPANPAAFLNKSDSQRKRFGGYIPIGKSPEHGFIFFLLFLFKSGGSNGIHRLRNQSVMFQCVFKQNAGRTVNTARRQVRRSVPVSFGQFHCNDLLHPVPDRFSLPCSCFLSCELTHIDRCSWSSDGYWHAQECGRSTASGYKFPT